uniref:CCR4-NOT transcription complex subunit 4 n=1 Tax=Ananas comosus var. bracteatus TaxID=296719 RepID=A0A6V7NGE3_ANACO|nr:unnamed protein product [Ananas comosus var. bracteatus]
MDGQQPVDRYLATLYNFVGFVTFVRTCDGARRRRKRTVRTARESRSLRGGFDQRCACVYTCDTEALSISANPHRPIRTAPLPHHLPPPQRFSPLLFLLLLDSSSISAPRSAPAAMTTMSDDGDRTCPLCAEEMDLTDQQLKPCKCGYDICVWCWHHIMDMAEKEDAEGRCPACRTPYDKERIVAANCKRVVAEISAEKKHKSQKVKPKASVEARKHLGGVRVIQRNLVYIIGLPYNLCDESILERREYFGQYGKVLKVSISRPTGAAAQQASLNNTFSVYITYAKEEEAVRCIQAVHNFVLDGKSLRACFGTTKYCHAWLKNMTCSNPDCLYLHDVGSQEDSFTKDEIISAYTRSRVPQIASNLQRRSGNILPPPADDFSSSGTASSKPALKNGSNIASSQTKISPPNSSAGKSTLPAAASWGNRGLNSKPTAASMSFISSTKPVISAWHDDVDTSSKSPESKQVIQPSNASKPLEPYQPGIQNDYKAKGSAETFLDVDLSSGPSAWNDDVVVTSEGCEGKAAHFENRSLSLESLKAVTDEVSQPSTIIVSPEVDERDIPISRSNSITARSPRSEGLCRKSIGTGRDKITEGHELVDENVQNLCSDLSSVCLDSSFGANGLKADQPQTLVLNTCSAELPLKQTSNLELSFTKQVEQLPSPQASKGYPFYDQFGSSKPFDWSSELPKQGTVVNNNNQRLGHSNVITQTSSSSYQLHPSNTANLASYSSWSNDFRSEHSSFTDDSRTGLLSSLDNSSILSNSRKGDEQVSSFGNPERVFERPGMKSLEDKANCIGRYENSSSVEKAASVDKGESSIISDILSLDFDPWDDSLSSANNLAKMLGESEKAENAFKFSNSWKLQNSNQSRFSFAWQESEGNIPDPLIQNNHEQKLSLLQNSYGDRYQGGPVFNASEVPNAATNSSSALTFDRPTGASRSKISAPPGFSTPNRAPPPGFSSQDRLNQVYDTPYSENNLFGDHYQSHIAGNPGDIEFIDPAILAVGKGRMPGVNDSGLDLKSGFPAQYSHAKH